MADDNEEADEPVVELDEAEPVDGAPLARVSSRLHWPLQKSEVDRKEGESTIRTPDGPQELSSLLEQVDETYFQSEQEFTDEIRSLVGPGPVPTADGS
ncbi:DUF5789 family protein [Halomicrococcus gelatinilyticus]|uniref:DUF5789 family protein n=1 Tax=Halomicrococcus gelatinilyticus TaxID=1702103 RepID=UPI002E121A9F